MITETLLEQVCRARGGSPSATRVPPGHKATEAEIFRAYVASLSSEKANALYEQYGLFADPDIMPIVMANVCHETGGLRLVRENPNYSAKNLMKAWGMWYGIGKKGRDGKINRDSDGDGLSDLAEAHGGNAVLVMSYNYNGRMGNRPGSTDGYDMRGGGPFQSTGRDNYEWLEKMTGIPFGSKPWLIEEPEHWPLIICLTMTKKVGDLCAYAENGNLLAVCKAINTGSPNSKIAVVGMEDRNAWYAAWKKALSGATAAASTPLAPRPMAYRVGSPASDAVSAIQRRLNDLRYGEGRITVDANFGVRTRSAVTDFQMENGLAPDGVVGPATWALLMSKDAKAFPAPAAAQLGVKGLVAAGDPEAKAETNLNAAGKLLGLGAFGQLADMSGALDGLGNAAKMATGAQESVQTLVGVAKFGLSMVLPIAALLVAALIARRYGTFIYERIEKWTRPIGGEAS